MNTSSEAAASQDPSSKSLEEIAGNFLDLNTIISDYLAQQIAAQEGEVTLTDRDPYAWVLDRMAQLHLELDAFQLGFLRVFCNGIPPDFWQVLDERTRRDIITNSEILTTFFGARKEDESYTPAVVAVTYSVLEALIARRAVYQAAGRADDELTLEGLISSPGLVIKISERIVTRLWEGVQGAIEYTCPSCGAYLPSTAQLCVGCSLPVADMTPLINYRGPDIHNTGQTTRLEANI